ncbi:hypothetical protein PRZ48_002692 [Zasmidium cellare]|uniref:MFS transporter n=1 Tax=Zasmidium cellare TaxID=395010 RepID=A0ABR0ETY5_ZASCE|nr:hypothetical protein PRZ48_002692 [Zasmidium cellare]
MSDIQDDLSLAPREFAPGTVVLFDKELHGRLPHLQSTVKGKDRILLIPQPSLTDPSDPLRWPSWKKHLTLVNGLLYSFNGAMTGPIMAAGMVPLSKQFGKSLQRLSYANGVTLVMQGVATTVWM